MNHSRNTQATAFSLAVIVTLALIASINQLATSPTTAATMARADTAPAQVVVITGKRMTQS